MNKAIGIGIKSGYVTLSLTVAAATILCLAPRAAVAYAGEGVLDEPVGTATEKAFELQRGGTQSVPVRPMSGEEASLAYDRYMQSFTQPIPVFFGSSLKSSSDSGASGSQ